MNQTTNPKDLLPNDTCGPFTVKGIKNMETRDGVAWRCNIYRDNQKVGTAENDGHGGCSRIYATGANSRSDAALESELVEAARAAGWPESRTEYLGKHAVEMRLDAEDVILQLMEAKETLARLRRLAKTKIVAADGSDHVTFNAPPTPGNLAKCAELNPDLTILNGVL